MFCSYKYPTSLPPCVVLRVNKYSYLEDLFNDKIKNIVDLEIAVKIKCIEFKTKYININKNNCINCMYCVFACPGNKIEIHSNYVLKAMCSDFTFNYEDRLNENMLNNLFNGNILKLPTIGLNQFNVKYKSFTEYTETNETTNISVWGANTMKYLSSAQNPKLGLEIGMKIESRDRGGRLDICLLNEGILFVAEAKVSLVKMLNEGRYISQLLAYEQEITATLKKLKVEIRHYKFLLIGGLESDLLPPSHPQCTSKIGNSAEIFYKALIENKFFFISANALLSLGLLKIFKGEMYSLENIVHKLFQPGHLGLTSAGIIHFNGKEIELIKMDK